MIRSANLGFHNSSETSISNDLSLSAAANLSSDTRKRHAILSPKVAEAIMHLADRGSQSAISLPAVVKDSASDC
jgi:hypothetical protein